LWRYKIEEEKLRKQNQEIEAPREPEVKLWRLVAGCEGELMKYDNEVLTIVVEDEGWQ